jgi:hypothetical protein
MGQQKTGEYYLGILGVVQQLPLLAAGDFILIYKSLLFFLQSYFSFSDPFSLSHFLQLFQPVFVLLLNILYLSYNRVGEKREADPIYSAVDDFGRL